MWDGLRKQGVLVVTALDVIEAVLLGGRKDKVIGRDQQAERI